MTTDLGGGRVEFRFFRRYVKGANIVGSFNGWNQSANPMMDLGDGWWSATLDLAPGEYQFRYVADEKWFTDYAAHGIERSRFAWNSVLLVSGASRVPARSAA